MATSARKIAVKESVTADKAVIATQKPALKKATKKPQKTATTPVVKTVLSPTAAWPFPTGPRP